MVLMLLSRIMTIINFFLVCEGALLENYEKSFVKICRFLMGQKYQFYYKKYVGGVV